MSQLEIYLFLFTDSLIGGLVLPVKQELVFTAMRIFGGYNLYLASLIASTGITLAACGNWLLGRALRSLKNDLAPESENPYVIKILAFLEKYGYLAALLGFIPIIGPILTVFAGLVQTNFLKVVSLVFIVNLSWHLLRVM